MLAVLTSSADGVPHDDEIEAVQWRLAPQLVRLEESGRRRALEWLTQSIDQDGLPGTLQHLRNAIATSKHEEAFQVVLDIAWADRRMTNLERRHVDHVASLFGIPQAHRDRLMQEHLAKPR